MARQVAAPSLALNSASQRIMAGKLPANPDAGAYAGVLITGSIAVTLRRNHGAPQLVEHHPGGLVTLQPELARRAAKAPDR